MSNQSGSKKRSREEFSNAECDSDGDGDGSGGGGGGGGGGGCDDGDGHGGGGAASSAAASDTDSSVAARSAAASGAVISADLVSDIQQLPSTLLEEAPHGTASGADSAVDELKLFLSDFEKKTKGTIANWKVYSAKAEHLRHCLREIVVREINVDTIQAEVNDLLAPKIREELFEGIDMLIDWSKVDHCLTRFMAVNSKDAELYENIVGSLGFHVTNALDEIQQIEKVLLDKKTMLKILCTFSNKTETGTYDSQHGTTCVETPLSTEYVQKSMRGVKIPSPLLSSQSFAMGDDVKAEHFGNLYQLVDEQEKKDLEAFAVFLNNLILKSEIKAPLKIKSRQTKKYVKDMQITAEKIINWQKTDAKNEEGTFPNEVAGEKAAVQPILYAVLRALSHIGIGPGHEDIHRGRMFACMHATETKRFIDFETGCMRAFSLALLPMETTMAVEVKNVVRSKKTPTSMLEEAENQLMGHMAKRLLVAFELGNVGIDGFTMGLLITPVYVQLLRLELCGMGTTSVELKLVKTPITPLVSQEAFEKIVQNDKHKTELQNVKKLFDNTNTAEKIPAGMKLLWQLLHTSNVCLGASFFNQESTCTSAVFLPKVALGCLPTMRQDISWKAGILIGTGSHGTVYDVVSNTPNDIGENSGESPSDRSNYVIKASSVGETQHIAREVRALQALRANKDDRCGCITQLVAVGRLEYEIRKVKIAVPAILLSPRGSPVSATRVGRMDSCAAEQLWKDIKVALEYAHKNNVFHLDVRLGNVIHCQNKYILIDWTSAAFADEKIMGFRGSLPFAHLEVHSKGNTTEWRPKPKYDLASLAFTMAACLGGECIPWHGFYKRINDKDEKCFDDRRMIAVSLFDDATFVDRQLKVELKNWTRGA